MAHSIGEMDEGPRLGAATRARVGAMLKTSFLRNSFFLLLTSYSGNIFGFVFWLVVARTYPPQVVGLGVAVFGILSFLSTAATMGLPFGIIRFLPVQQHKPEVVNSAIGLSSIMSLFLGFVFLGGAGIWAPALAVLSGDAVLILGFVLSVWLFTLANLVDTVFTALKRAVYGTLRSSIYNIIRVVVPLVFAGTFGLIGILFAWILGLIISVVFGVAWLLPRLLDSYRFAVRVRGSEKNGILGYSLLNHGVNIASLATSSLLPLIILDSPGISDAAAASAYFYSAFAVATVLHSVANSFTTSLFVEGSHPNSQYARDLRRSVLISGVLIVLGIVAIVLFGNVILRLYGGGYEVEGYTVLLLFALSSPLVLGMSVYTAHLRVMLRTRILLAITVASCVATLAIAVLLVPRVGILGAAEAFVAGQALGMLLFALDDLSARLRARGTVPKSQ